MINVERKPDNPNKSIWSKIDDIKLNPTMKVYVSVKNVNELMVNGGGKIVSENSIASDNLTLGVTGSGTLDLDVKGKNIKTELSGSGSIILKGYASYNDIMMSGSGNLNAFNLELETAKIKVSGAGLAEITVSNSLDAMVVGSGVVKTQGQYEDRYQETVRFGYGRQGLLMNGQNRSTVSCVISSLFGAY